MYDGKDSWGVSTSITQIDDDGMQNLITAIVALAIQDLQHGKGRPCSERERNYYSALTFVQSEWFEFLTGLDGEEVLKLLKKYPKRFHKTVAERKEIRERMEDIWH